MMNRRQLFYGLTAAVAAPPVLKSIGAPKVKIVYRPIGPTSSDPVPEASRVIRLLREMGVQMGQ